MTSLKLAILS